MRILALDMGAETGWAHSAGPSGVWKLKVLPDESDGMRLVRFVGKLDELKRSLGVDLVVFESARNLKYGKAIRASGELQGVLKKWCLDNGVEYKGFSPGQIKRHATGRGRASKEEMVAAAKKRWSRVSDHNEADALWLLSLARNTYDLNAVSEAGGGG